MATGLSMKLTGQIGEHLVVAELGRRKIIATPFAGNVPDIDVLAYANNKSTQIQVKAINSDSWQFDIRKFLDVELLDEGQVVRGRNKHFDRKLFCVFVSLGDSIGSDIFYIFRQGWLQSHFQKKFKGRKPPKNIKSFHCAIWKKEMTKHIGRWDLIEKELGVLG